MYGSHRRNRYGIGVTHITARNARIAIQQTTEAQTAKARSRGPCALRIVW